MKKVLYIGDMQDCGYPIFVEASYTDGRLSLHGVEGPLKSGDCKGSAGQIQDYIQDARIAGDLSKEQIDKLHSIWESWHLNDMTAGSPAQEKFLKENPVNTHTVSHYQAAVIALKAAGLSPDPECIVDDKPYKYGTSWLHVEVPADVIAWLENLPASSRTPNWV